MRSILRTLAIFVALGAWSAHAQTTSITRFPADRATGINPDTHLVLTFASVPTIGKSGQIRIYDTSSHHLVDTLDLGVPAGPDPSRRFVSPPAQAIDPNPPTPTTTTPAVRTTPADLHNYQLRTVGGLADFHFFPIIVRGYVATIYPHSDVLKFHHAYAVEIDRGVLTPATGTFAGFGPENSWNFTTKVAPPSATKSRLIVAADGTGDFSTIQGAADFVPNNPTHRITIFIKNGNYEEIVFVRNKSNLTFRGEDRDKVQVGYGNNSAFNPPMPGPSRRCAFSVYDSTGIELENFSVSNYFFGQAEGLLIFGSKNIVSNMNIKGSGDALNLRGSVYLKDSTIIGDGDTILGVGPAFFDRCEIRSLGPFMWIRNTEANHGNVFVNSTFIAIERQVPWPVTSPQSQSQTTPAAVTQPRAVSAVLARLPNNHGLNYPYAEAVLIDCHLRGVPKEGWGPIDGDTTHIHFWEFHSTDLEGNPVDTIKRHPASRQLIRPQDSLVIANYSNPTFVLGWKPAARQ